MNDDVVQAAYIPVVRLQCYGMESDFGEYHKETGELKILDASMIGDVNLTEIRRHLDECNKTYGIAGSHMTFNIPTKIYHLRQTCLSCQRLSSDLR